MGRSYSYAGAKPVSPLGNCREEVLSPRHFTGSETEAYSDTSSGSSYCSNPAHNTHGLAMAACDIPTPPWAPPSHGGVGSGRRGTGGARGMWKVMGASAPGSGPPRRAHS